jgi:RNA polymerase sigma factor (sigma-70 family)
MIRAWCLRWGSQVSDADDLAQEVLTKLVTAIQTFRYDPDRSFRAWLKTVTQNARTDFARTQRLRAAAGPGRILAIADSYDALVDLEKQMKRPSIASCSSWPCTGSRSASSRRPGRHFDAP